MNKIKYESKATTLNKKLNMEYYITDK